MKKFSIIIAVSALLIFSFSNKVIAQKEKGQVVISAGAGYYVYGSEIGLGIDYDSEKYSEPVLNGMMDYGITDFFSMGIAVSYQKMGVEWEDYLYYDDTIHTEDVTEELTCLNIGVRPLFHFIKNDYIGMYTGFRLGYSLWTYEHDSEDPDWKDPNFERTRMSIQTLLGLRTYFSKVVGMHIEIAMGTPYVAAVGLSIRLGHSKDSPSM
ncbi:MAG: hypothetical protein ABII90_04715 [Bacteroidota bacterium]